jgi:spermidine synthase
MQGLHLTADLYQCACDDALMLDAQAIAALCRRQTEDAGLTRVDDRWVQFPAWQGQPGGVTGTVLLAESHLAIHTWPETGNVTIDVYVCNFSADNSGKAQALLDEIPGSYKDIDQVMRENAPAGWKGDSAREAQVLNALYPVMNRDEAATVALFGLLKNQPGN